jgi:hypothetical protein
VTSLRACGCGARRRDAFDAVYGLLAPSVFGIVRRVVRDPAQVRPIAGNHCGDAGLKGTACARMEVMSFRSGAAVALGLSGIIIARAPAELATCAWVAACSRL